ncbi:carboxypeptidase-like regulatory domain-containing protein [uncultured Lacinutrix sp.]|uniref:TonB-dependent receptor plug domain-containing protein n=1 Tax=uncultured Lacinutrix sp. TaxID=574032 RepID=UPI00262D33A2|nr:carboxypeptidase-like regulatory domain-containing protein [uncultured Lacinutrix sp.]
MKSKDYLFCLFILVFNLSFSQITAEKIPLNTFLKSTETKFDVKFSYAPEDILDIEIKRPSTDFDLQNTLTYLNNNTLLNFKALDKRYITVSVLDKRITICGLVYGANNEPLLGTSIIINNTQTGTTTNTIGAFKLNEVPLNAKITISFLGYENQELIANQLFSEENNCRKIKLLESNFQLNQVYITKFLTTGLQKRLDGSTVLNTEQFGILPGLIEPDILQSIQALPGVESANESIANINVRGGSNDENLMLWDDIKMYHSGHFFGLISAYNPNLTNKVTVSKNGTSSQYSDGVSSTINMSTKNELSNSFSGGAGINLISGDAFFEIPITKKLELHVSGRRSFTDVLSTPTYDNYFTRSFQDSDLNNNQSIENGSASSDFAFYDYSAKLLFDLNDKHSFRTNVIYINNNLDYSETNTDSNNSTTTKSSHLTQKNLGFGGHWQANWSSKFKTKLLAYYSRYTVDASDLRVETNQLLQQGNQVLETGIKLNSFYHLNSNLTLLAGYQFNETGISNSTNVSLPVFDREKKDVLLNHALYTEGEYRKGKTYIRAGVRASYFQKFNKLLIDPRINLRQKLSRQLALKIEGEFKNQSATQKIDFQDDFLGVENRRWILANEEDIPITTSKQASLGLEFKQNNLNIETTGFYKLVSDITAGNQGFYNNFQYLDATGNYTAKGIEFLINKTTNKHSTWLSYTYSINDYEFKSFTPSAFPNNIDIRHSATLAFNYNILEDLKISVGALWRSGQPYTKPLEGNETVQDGNTLFVNYDLPNNENLDDFLRLDTSISYSFKLSNTTKGTLNLGIINLTNQNNVINRYYEVDTNDTEKTIEIDNKSLKLTPNVSFRIRF